MSVYEELQKKQDRLREVVDYLNNYKEIGNIRIGCWFTRPTVCGMEFSYDHKYCELEVPISVLELDTEELIKYFIERIEEQKTAPPPKKKKNS